MRLKRLAKVLSIIKKGDYLFIQFGHNDQKEHYAGVGPFKKYTTDLMKMIADVRQRGATPVLVTPVSWRIVKGDKIINSFGDCPQAMRRLSKSDNVPLIDLNKASATFYEALGQKVSRRAFAPPSHNAPIMMIMAAMQSPSAL